MAKSKKKMKVKAKPKAKKIIKKAAKKIVKAKTKKKIAAPKKTKAKKIQTKTKAFVKKVVAKKPTVVAKKVEVDYTKAITPLADRLVIRLVEGEKVTAGGLIIPDSVNTAIGYLKGLVLAIGSGTKNKKGFVKPMDVKIGDTVLFSQYSGIKVNFNSEDLQIIKETDVMGIVNT